MNDNKGSPTKKRKANDDRATTDDTHDVMNGTGNNNDGGFLHNISRQRNDASSASCDENNRSQLDRMEVIMMRMEEKLATVSSLESRCEQLEAKCSSLENLLESTSQSAKEHIDRKFDSLYLHLEQKCSSLENRLDTKVDTVHVKLDKSLKFHEYNSMLLKNQKWEYSAVVDTTDELIDNGYNDDEAFYLGETAEDLKIVTTKMRQGEFTCGTSDNKKGVFVEMNDIDPPANDAVNTMLLPHWKEFAAALQQFTPAINVLPDEYESIFMFGNVQLNHDAMLLIKEALIGKPFQKLSCFMHNNNGEGAPAGMSVDAIFDIVESNKHLRKLQIEMNRIGSDHIERLCSAVHNHALVELDLSGCFEPGIGDEMLTALLTIDGLKLELLDMADNNITSAVSTLLTDFLATNPMLKELHLEHNRLNDSDATLIANALRTNATLRSLDLYGNRLTQVGVESLRLALCDESSLNSVAGSNHRCHVRLMSSLALRWKNNLSEDMGQNRGRKMYRLLSSRNKTMSNVQHFGDVDVKLLPNMLDAVQKYSNGGGNDCVKAASIVYEIMRFWDQVTPFIGRV